MPEVIQIFESLSRDLLKEGTVLPDSILAKKLLKVANLNESDEKLARATCPTLTTAEMKKSLLRLADTQTTKRYGESKMPTMKTEPCFMASTDNQHPSGPHSYEPPYPYQPYPHEEIMFNRNTRGQRGRFQRPNFEPRNNANQNRQCFGCYSPHHWIRDCPLMPTARPQGQKNHQFRPPYQPTSRHYYHQNQPSYHHQDQPSYHQRPRNSSDSQFRQRPPLTPPYLLPGASF